MHFSNYETAQDAHAYGEFGSFWKNIGKAIDPTKAGSVLNKAAAGVVGTENMNLITSAAKGLKTSKSGVTTQPVAASSSPAQAQLKSMFTSPTTIIGLAAVAALVYFGLVRKR